MNDREIAEIRRRMRPDKNSIGRIRGCYVNDNHTIISEFDQMLGLISSNEAEELLSHLRKVLSGVLGRNLIDVSFSNQQVLDSDEHRLLTSLRSSSLTDNDAVNSFFEKAVASINIEGSYFIILANDKYDVIKYDENGEKGDSFDTFSYILCAVCPIKNAKPTLGYSIAENSFKNVMRDSMISAPELGFMFPVFENRGANIYNAMLYTRDIADSHDEFVNTVFNTSVQKPAAEQSIEIAEILNDTVKEDCSLDLIQAVQSQLIEITADHKANREAEPLLLTPKDVGTLLRSGGVSEESVKEFTEKFEESFGSNAAIPPANILDTKKFEVKTPEVTIKVKPEFSDLVQTKIIDGTKYLVIRADSDIEVNGVRITINDNE